MSVDLSAVVPAELDRVMARALGELGVLVNAPLKVLGRRLGLWRALAGAGPTSPAALAARTGLVERYVREWLFSQAASGWLAYDEAGGTFTLDDASAAVIAVQDNPAYFSLLTADGIGTAATPQPCCSTRLCRAIPPGSVSVRTNGRNISARLIVAVSSTEAMTHGRAEYRRTV